MLQLYKDLQIFGEGGDGGAGAATGQASGTGDSAETGVNVPDAGERKQRRPDRSERARVEFGQPTGTTNTVKEEAPSAKTEPQEQPKESYKEFRERFKDEIGREIEAAVRGRFKNYKDASDRAARMEALLSRMGSLDYEGIVDEDGKLDLDKLEKAVDDDDKYYEKKAAERGWSTETEKYVSRLERKDAARQAEEAAKQKDILQRQQFEQRMAQAGEARKIYPGLDFFVEMENRTFASLMANPLITVQQAYELVHRDEIRESERAKAEHQTAQRLSASIQAGASRPAEGGLGVQSAEAVQWITDPRQLTREQRKLLKKRAARGEEIVW